MGEAGISTEVRLVRPSVRYRDSVLDAVREFQAEGGYRAYSLASLTNDFAAFVQHLLDNEDPGKVPPTSSPKPSTGWSKGTNSSVARRYGTT